MLALKYQKEKLFWIARNASKDVVCITWDEKIEYYSFVKSVLKDGYHQISVASELMLQIISDFCGEENWKIDKIEMMEEDFDLRNQLEDLIVKCKANPATILKITQYLEDIVEESSIEIKRVYFSRRDQENKLSSFYIQVNGIVGVSQPKVINDKLCACIREYI